VQSSVDGAPAPEPDAPPPDARPQTGMRDGRAAVIAGDRVVWSVEARGCSHEDDPPCQPTGPSVLRAGVDGAEQEVLLSNLYGARAIATDGSQVFAVVLADDFTTSLVKLDDGAPPAIVAAVDGDTPLALDASYVYWTTGTSVVRASRDGDGSDVAVVADLAFWADQLEIDGGQLYATNRSNAPGAWRVVVEGGVPERVLEGNISGFAVRDGTVYAARSLDGPTPQIIARYPDGAVEVLVAVIASWVHDVTVDDDSLFWVQAGDLYRTTIGLDASELVAPGDTFVHAIMPTSILLDFGDEGFNVLPR
jgi:hypothetical protein